MSKTRRKGQVAQQGALRGIDDAAAAPHREHVASGVSMASHRPHGCATALGEVRQRLAELFAYANVAWWLKW